jgi:hypothetical protein
MNDCIPVEEMGTLSGLPADHERRRHVASCPRCSSLMFVYDQFVKAESVEAAKPKEAEEHLERFITERIGAATPAPAAPVSGTRPRRWFDITSFRIAAAAAAVVVVALACGSRGVRSGSCIAAKRTNIFRNCAPSSRPTIPSC